MINFRVQIFYVAIITVIVCVGNLISVVHVFHPEVEAQKRGEEATPTPTPILESIIFYNQHWLHYAGNTLSIVTSLPLLFVITTRVERNKGRRLGLIPYVLCSLIMVIVPQYIIFESIVRHDIFGDAQTTTAVLNNTENGEKNSNIVFKMNCNCNNTKNDDKRSKVTKNGILANDDSTTTNNNSTTAAIPTRVTHNTSKPLNNTKNDDKKSEVVFNCTTTKDGILANDDNTTILKTTTNYLTTQRERISSFIIYQLWIVIRTIFFFLVCRYFYFLQCYATAKPQPKRTNATRRGVIDIQINGKTDDVFI